MRLRYKQLFNSKILNADIEEYGFNAGYKRLLSQANSYFDEQFLNACPADELVTARSWLVDQILIHLWGNLIHPDSDEHQKITLMAVGGYGRSELHPFSDIDLLIVHDKELTATDEEHITKLVQTIWDIGLQPGHSVRTIKQCKSLSQSDVTVYTNLIESRYLCGDSTLSCALDKLIRQKTLWPIKKFIDAKVQEQELRHQKFDNTQENLEPNIKDGPGGLRDIQTIFWIAAKFSGILRIKDLVENQILSIDEARTLRQCRNHLWRLRYALHYYAKGKEERLLFNYQHKIADLFNFVGDNNTLGVEKLMKRYYRTARDISFLNEILLHHFIQLCQTKKSSREITLTSNFKIIDGYIEIAHPNTFSKNPICLLEVFYLEQTQSRSKGIGVNTIRSLRQNIHLIDAQLRNDPASKEIFLDILKHPSGQTHTLRRMNNYGVLGRYIPAFGRIVGQMQYDLFHVYTVDAHTLMVVRQMRRFCLDQFRDEFPQMNDIMRLFKQKELLYLGALLHDIGKGRGGDHSLLGEKIAFNFCKKLGLNHLDRNFIAWLVKHHLLMSWTAQREDISNPLVINKFAKQVIDIHHLNALYLLTVADMIGTSPKVFTPWKGQLLSNLYDAAKRALQQEMISIDDIEQRAKDIKANVMTLIDPSILPEVQKFWAMHDDHYFLRFTSETLAWHCDVMADAKLVALPLVAGQYKNDLESNQFFVFSADFDELLPRFTSAMDNLNQSIVSAQILRLKNRMALMNVMTMPLYQSSNAHKEIEKLAQDVHHTISSPLSRNHIKKRRISRQHKQFPITTRINFTQSENGQMTIMGIVAQDRPSLLHCVALGLYELKIQLHTARINTLGERVDDYFFITDRDNQPLSDPETLSIIEEKITTMINALIEA